MDSFGEAEVSQSRIFVVIQEDIVGFDVPMDDVSRVQVVHSLQDLPEDLPFELLTVAGIRCIRLLEEVLEGFTVTVLHLDVENLDARKI